MNILTANIGETVDFLDWGKMKTETVLLRDSDITITADKNGRISSWMRVGYLPEESDAKEIGYIFSLGTTAEQAMEIIRERQAGLAGIAKGAANAESIMNR